MSEGASGTRFASFYRNAQWYTEGYDYSSNHWTDLDTPNANVVALSDAKDNTDFESTYDGSLDGVTGTWEYMSDRGFWHRINVKPASDLAAVGNERVYPT
jgi:hypothetical protein